MSFLTFAVNPDKNGSLVLTNENQYLVYEEINIFIIVYDRMPSSVFGYYLLLSFIMSTLDKELDLK